MERNFSKILRVNKTPADGEVFQFFMYNDERTEEDCQEMLQVLEGDGKRLRDEQCHAPCLDGAAAFKKRYLDTFWPDQVVDRVNLGKLLDDKAYTQAGEGNFGELNHLIGQCARRDQFNAFCNQYRAQPGAPLVQLLNIAKGLAQIDFEHQTLVEQCMMRPDDARKLLLDMMHERHIVACDACYGAGRIDGWDGRVFLDNIDDECPFCRGGRTQTAVDYASNRRRLASPAEKTRARFARHIRITEGTD